MMKFVTMVDVRLIHVQRVGTVEEILNMVECFLLATIVKIVELKPMDLHHLINKIHVLGVMTGAQCVILIQKQVIVVHENYVHNRRRMFINEI